MFTLPVVLMMALCILSYTLSALFSKFFSSSYPGNANIATPVFSVIYGLIIGIYAIVVAKFQFVPSLETWTFGICCGTAIFLYNLGGIYAARTGPYALLSCIRSSGNVVVPLLFSVCWWNDRINTMQLAGIVLMVVALFVINIHGDREQILHKSYFFWVFLLFVSNGVVGVLNDSQQRVMMQTQRSEMMIVTYISSSAISVIYLLIVSGKGFGTAFTMLRPTWLWAVGSGVTAALGVHLLMMLLGQVTASILYAIQNGMILVLSVLLSVIMFHEKVTQGFITGTMLVILSLVLLSM